LDPPRQLYSRVASAGPDSGWQPGAGGEELGERAQSTDAPLGGGGQVGADDGEVGQALEGAPAAAGGALLDLDRAHVALGLIRGEATARSVANRRIMSRWSRNRRATHHTVDIISLRSHTTNKNGKTDSSIGRPVERKYTYDDALAAAEALREISAAHEEAAQAILTGAGLDALSTEELEAVCDQFGTEPLAAGRDHGAGGHALAGALVRAPARRLARAGSGERRLRAPPRRRGEPGPDRPAAPVREWGDPAQLPADRARDIPGQPGGQCRQLVFVTHRCDIRVQGDPRHPLGHVLVPELGQVGQELLQLLI
jgi:hypothetical protein